MKKKQGKTIMLVATGAYGNIGDAIIRRRVVHWVENAGELHVYVGNADAEWIRQLQLPNDAIIYGARDKLTWLQLPLTCRNKVALILDPGAVPLDRSALMAELMFLALGLAVRLRKGVVVKPPRGLGKTEKIPLFVHRLSARTSNLVLWRNMRSAEIVGHGKRCPDTAFQEAAEWLPEEGNNKRVLGISMRGKKEVPSDKWFQTIKHFASKHDLQIVVFAQVREDAERARTIANRLDGEYLAWNEESDLAHEADLRSLYRRALLIVSDRLHVLILGTLGGAVPFEYSDSPTDKVASHFEQIGITDIVLKAQGATSADFEAAALRALTNVAKIRGSVLTAARELDRIELEVQQLISQ